PGGQERLGSLSSRSPRCRRFARRHPCVMKQVLLRVSAVLPEMRFRKFTQLLCCRVFSTRKITLSQNALDPDVDRECAEPFIGKEHDAIRNLWPYTRQRAQLLAKLGIRKIGQFVKVTLARGDAPSS